jgi:hypothetical protein
LGCRRWARGSRGRRRRGLLLVGSGLLLVGSGLLLLLIGSGLLLLTGCGLLVGSGLLLRLLVGSGLLLLLAGGLLLLLLVGSGLPLLLGGLRLWVGGRLLLGGLRLWVGGRLLLGGLRLAACGLLLRIGNLLGRRRYGSGLCSNDGRNHLVEILTRDWPREGLVRAPRHCKPVPVEEDDLDSRVALLLLLPLVRRLFNLDPQQPIGVDEPGDLEVAGLGRFGALRLQLRRFHAHRC